MRKAAKWLAAPLLLLGFLYALVSIVMTPLESGDLYPEYSTLRADPLGTRILFDSLAELPGIEVARNFKRLSNLAGSKPGTLILMGASGPGFGAESEGQVKEWESLAAAGWRLVFVFKTALPALEANFDVFKKETPRKKEAIKIPPVQSRWGMRVKLRTATVEERAEIDRTPRHSALYFEGDGSWRVLTNESDGKASHVEKAIGKGSVALVSEIFPLSNEGLREKPIGDFASTLVGPNRRIVFDEAHNGVAETGSIGSLIRRYRLQGSVALLMLVGILFIWRNATSLLPLRAESVAVQVQGRTTQQGIVSLLRRNVGREQLLQTCLQEWERSLPLQLSISEQRAKAVRVAAAAGDPPVETYRQIHQVLTERK